MLSVFIARCVISSPGTAGGLFRQRRRCSLGRGFSTPSDTSISLFVLIRLRRANSYSGRASVSDSYDLHRRLRGPAPGSFPNDLPGRATNQRRVPSMLKSLPIGSGSYSHLTCCLPYPDFHQIPQYVTIAQDRAHASSPLCASELYGDESCAGKWRGAVFREA